MGLSGAGFGAANGLQELLKQRFIEAIQRQKLAEDMRQADMQHQVQQQQLGQGQQRIGLEGRRVGLDEQQYAEGAPLREANVAHIGAETSELQRRPQAETAQREFTHGENEASRGLTREQGAANRQNAVRVAGIRSTTAQASEPLVQATAPDGSTIYVPRSQASGMKVPQKAAPRMAASAAQMIGGAEASLHQLDKLEAMLPRMQSKIGPLAGRASSFQQGVPGIPVDREYAAFSAETATLKNATVKAITGAQMSEPEAKRIMQQVPLETDKPEVWVQKAKATRDNLSFMRDKMASLYGVDTPQAAPKTSSGFKVVEIK